MKIEKKGEITTTQIVMIIVLIVSFIVILYFFYRLNLGETNNTEICHNSVVLKSKSSGIASALDCRTDYICISGGGKCKDMDPTITVKVDSNNKKEIMKAIADKMTKCWWVFGEGKLNYGDKGLLGSNGCALCSVVEFDNKILDKGYDITYADFYNYLSKVKKDNAQTYLKYLYNTYDLANLEKNSPALKNNIDKKIITDNKYAIVTSFNTGWFLGFFGGNKLTPPAYVKTSQMPSELKCSGFITKA